VCTKMMLRAIYSSIKMALMPYLNRATFSEKSGLNQL
jgi:hypothetical protein